MFPYRTVSCARYIKCGYRLVSEFVFAYNVFVNVCVRACAYMCGYVCLLNLFTYACAGVAPT